MTDVPHSLNPHDATSAAGTGARILVIEDDPFSRDMLVRRLAARRFEVSSAPDGASGLARVPGLGGAGAAPDLILLDVNLPDMSGLEVLRRLRTSHSYDSLPVILVTALGESSDVIAGLGAGANDYVVKPVNLPVLLARMGVWLTVKQDVALLMEAERDRVMLETLGGACEQLAQPMTAMTVLLEMLTRQPPADPEELRGELSQVLAVTREAGALICRLREVARSRSVPYTRRIRMVDRPV